MFDKIKVNNFYNKLINNKKIDKQNFDNLKNDLKQKIISNDNYANYIDLNLILSNENQYKIIEEMFLVNLSDENLKIILNRLTQFYFIKDINLTNLFHFFKDKFLNTKDIELKELISKILYASVKESYSTKEEYINNFISILEEKEIIEMFKFEDMIKFITFHSFGTNPYYGYKNFFDIILKKVSDENIKYSLMHEIFKFMPKHGDVKTLYLKCLIDNLDNDNIIKLLSQKEIIEEYKYKDNLSFNYELILDIVILTNNYESKKQIIKDYFTNFEYINNLIINRNDSDNKGIKIDGNTIMAFYELNIIKSDFDEVIIKSCKDKLLFKILEKYPNKEEKLLEISHDVDINLLIEFAKKYDIDIFNETYAKKFILNSKYFEMLPKDKSKLICYYIGDNEDIFYEKLSNINDKENIIYNSYFKFNIDKLIYYSNKNNINIYTKKIAEKFKNNDRYYELLPKEKSDLICYYIGDNEDIFYDKLSNIKDKEYIINNSQFQFNLERLFEYSKKNNINIYTRKMAEKFKKINIYYEFLPKDKIELIKYYNGDNLDIFFNKLNNSKNKLEILLFNNIPLNIDSLLEESLKRNLYNDFDKKIILSIIKIKDLKLKNIYKDFIIKNYDNITENNLNIISILLNKIIFSNSIEILNFKSEIANQLIVNENPVENFEKIENIFIKNNLPNVAKVYSIFEILHPDFKGFNFDEDSKISPMLKNVSTRSKKNIIFNDLLKISLGSNNRSIKEYISNLEYGSKLFKLINAKKIKISELNNDNKIILDSFLKNVITLYNNTYKGKKNNLILSDSLLENVKLINSLYPDTTNLSDKIVSMFCHFAGFDRVNDLKNYINNKIKEKQEKNKTLKLSLDNQDLIKGIDRIEHFKNILQNGSVAKEFLGAYSSSDLTPLDTDLSMVVEKKESLEETINNTSSKNYGNFWIVLKNDERFITTRTSENKEEKIKSDKYELFYTGKTGKDHYGIRTGFASSDIDFIITKDNDPRIGLEIAMNGFYIPVINLKNEVIFSIEDYNNIINKMSGLSYYGINNYKFSNNLFNSYISDIQNNISKNREYSKQIKKELHNHFKNCLENMNLKLKDYIDGDLTDGTVELIDIGSTGRETNVDDNGDFDYVMRIDNSILNDENKLNKLKDIIINSFESISEKTITNSGDFRFRGVKIKNLDKYIDIDITFTQKTNKIKYSTDRAIKDRLDTIKNIDKEKYDLVLANIILAKKVLKSSHVYKPNRGTNPEGGLGGVGIENWILQNGGSFIEAATTFMNIANNKSFEEFKKNYYIWDFGENYISSDKEFYPHDNFINNMNEEGYNKMKIILTKYLNNSLYISPEQNKTL